MKQSTPDARWRRDFVLGLRLRNAPATTIADHLKLVETHCAESGESAGEAFGDPTAYAQGLAGNPADSVTELAPLLPAAVLGFLAGAMTLEGVKGLVRDEAVTVRAGDLGGAAVLVVAAVGVMVLLGRARRPLPTTCALLLVAVVSAVLLDVADTPAIAVWPAWLALAIGIAALCALGPLGVREARRERIADPISGEPML